MEECCLYVEYRSMGESPDISGAWNVRERESQVGPGLCRGWLVGSPAWYSGTVQFTGIESWER